MQTPVHERITTIKTGNVNSYLIGTEKGFVLIDTGTPNSFPRFQQAFDNVNIAFSDLICIVITHTHYDHAGCAAEIQTRSSAPVIVHEAEAEFTRQGFTPLPKGTGALGRMILKAAKGARPAHGNYPPFTPAVTVSKQYDLSEFGIRGFVVPTPGHTNGSVSIILENEACFTGDSLFHFFFTARYYPPFADDEKTLLQTWEYFTTLPCTVFYPGHGKPISKRNFLDAFEKITRKYRST